MFTLAHELAHIWLGQSALSDVAPASVPSHARDLVQPGRRGAPRSSGCLPEEYNPKAQLRAELDRLARRSRSAPWSFCAACTMPEGLTADQFWRGVSPRVGRLRALPSGGGGDFYLTLGARASKRFARALVVRTLEGQSSFMEAFRLLGLKKMATFQELGNSLGVGL